MAQTDDDQERDLSRPVDARSPNNDPSMMREQARRDVLRSDIARRGKQIRAEDLTGPSGRTERVYSIENDRSVKRVRRRSFGRR